MKIGKLEIYFFTNFDWLSITPNIEMCVSGRQLTLNWLGIYLAVAISKPRFILTTGWKNE